MLLFILILDQRAKDVFSQFLSMNALFGFEYLFNTVKRGKMTDHDQDSLVWQPSSRMSRKFLPWILPLIASVQTLAPNDVIL